MARWFSTCLDYLLLLGDSVQGHHDLLRFPAEPPPISGGFRQVSFLYLLLPVCLSYQFFPCHTISSVKAAGGCRGHTVNPLKCRHYSIEVNFDSSSISIPAITGLLESYRGLFSVKLACHLSSSRAETV